MRKLILRKLNEIEREHNVRILLAVESGSRAWGFASPDSDYDVRFIYVRPKEAYLRLDEVRDVIELPINDGLDINGWDLKKTLRLLYKSNPTLFEWFSSPIVYMETDFANLFRRVMNEYFSQKKALYHYISMAERNYCEFLKSEQIKAKKYFYVLRPVFACNWVLDKGFPPPMLFSELADAELPEYLKDDVNNLLRLKVTHSEIKKIERIDSLNAYLCEAIEEIKGKISQYTNNHNDWSKLNKMFQGTLT